MCSTKNVTRLDFIGYLSRWLTSSAHQVLSQIFLYVRVTLRATTDSVQTLKAPLVPKLAKHRSAITEPAELGRR